MLKKIDCLKVIRDYKSKYALDTTDENIIAAIHLMNTHGVHVDAALDQSSRSSNDHGIDAWFYNEISNELYIYQSKLSNSKTQALYGFGDLDASRQWLEQVIITGTTEKAPTDNQCLYNLYLKLGQFRKNVKKIHFILISLYNQNEIEDSVEFEKLKNDLIKSALNTYITKTLKGSLVLDTCEYNLEKRLPESVKIYPIDKIPNTEINIRANANLNLAYIKLESLIQLYRQRGDILFDKNVRLSLLSNKEARQRLVHPMEETFIAITEGKLSPNIFPFYHIGITIAAYKSTNIENNLLQLEAPSIINGCQTIMIAHEFLKKLELYNNKKAIDLFKKINVIAKIVVGTSDEELKEITNSNNRQNPIENWQLFSNESIHIEIETSLKDAGVFYERQQGKFDALMKNADNAKDYPSTGRACVKVVDLGQSIALARYNLQWAAKPSEIFLNKINHDKIFDQTIPDFPNDIVFVSNIFKAMKRGLSTFLETPSQANSTSPLIFRKPIVRMHIFYLTLLYFYQNNWKQQARAEFHQTLLKKANPKLVEQTHTFFQKFITKTRNWYVNESKNLAIDVSKRSLDKYFEGLAIELGIDATKGTIPFTANAIDWKKYI